MAASSDGERLREKAEEAAARRFCRCGAAHPALAELRDMCVERMLAGADTPPDSAAPAACAEHEPPAFAGKGLDPLALAKGDLRLKSFPQTVAKMQEVAADTRSSAQDMGRVVSLDPGLTAFVLRVVNSAAYGFAQRVETVSRAVAVLGTRQLADLALCRSLLDFYDAKALKGFDAASFWTHAMAVGIVARALAAQRGGEVPERYFVAGLLHDVGKPALWSAKPELAARAADIARRDSLLSHEAERQVFGFDHARFGAIVLRSWNVPFSLGNALLRHHEPSDDNSLQDAGPVHVADVIVTALGKGPAPWSPVPPLHPSAWDSLRMEPAGLRGVARELDAKLGEAVGLFVGR